MKFAFQDNTTSDPLKDEWARRPVIQRLVLAPGERRGYWKHHATAKLFQQSNVFANINNVRCRILFDTGAQVSILDSAFAREAGIEVATQEKLECVGVGGSSYYTDGRATVKVTLAGELAYEFKLWVGPLGEQQAILGMDFMVPAGVRLDLADGSACLPEEVRVRFEGRRQVFSDKCRHVWFDQTFHVEPGENHDIRLRGWDRQKLWIRRGVKWVPTVVTSWTGEPRFLRITNVSDEDLTVGPNTVMGMWLNEGHIPRKPGFVSIGSRRYEEWQTLALEASTEAGPADGSGVEDHAPLVPRVEYPWPTGILKKEIQPQTPSIASVTRVSDLKVNQKDMEDTVFVNEGSELAAEAVEQEMAVIPEVPDPEEEITPEDIQIGGQGEVDEADRQKMRDLIWSYRHLCMGKGNALPPAAKGAVCDIDVGDAKPIAQRVRKVPSQFLDKVFKLIKSLLTAGMVQPSTSPWASPIVIVVKKNKVDIRLCIDYREVNKLTRLMVYPMPLVNDLLENLDQLLWFCSLDMASGFWVVSMTERARAISAFVTPFGLFEWTRMPFGLKSAPQIYQRLVDNALYGMLLIPAVHAQDDKFDVFAEGEPEDVNLAPVLGRRSYIDDILFGCRTWAELLDRLRRLLEACEQWGLSISLPKSTFGMKVVDYLGHRVSKRGLEAALKNFEKIRDLPFPRSLKAMQSFLGSINYYCKFVEDHAVFAASLYELKESDFHQEEGAESLAAARRSFEILKGKVTTAPILRHFDADKIPVVILYANDWAISAALTQQHDKTLMPVRFVSRVLKDTERRYSQVEKEILALLKALDACFNMLAGRPIRVITRSSALAWLFRSKGLQGRLQQWAAVLSPWSLTVEKAAKGEEELLGLMAASITPRREVDKALEEIAPRKASVRPSRVECPLPKLSAEEEAFIISSDGSAKPDRSRGGYSAILWRWPTWEILEVASEVCEQISVNEAEYRGILLGLQLASRAGIRKVVICGDSNLCIRQLRGEMACRSEGLKVLWEEGLSRLGKFDAHHLVHVKREFNEAADAVVRRAMSEGRGVKCSSPEDRASLREKNRLPEVLLPFEEDHVTSGRPIIAVTTRQHNESRGDARGGPIREPDRDGGVAEERKRRITQAQDEETWIADLKTYLRGDLAELTPTTSKQCARLADRFEVDRDGTLVYLTKGRRGDEREDGGGLRVVLPTTLHDEILHHYHTSHEGGHQGVLRTYFRIRERFYWRGLYKTVQEFVATCTDCETGKGSPNVMGRSPGNLVATHPFQIIGMDHMPSLPKSFRGNTELLIWVDHHTGFLIAEATASREAQTIAEAYERSVFRRFGASEIIRHDREPGFMSEVFRAFNKMIGQQQRATLAYRPQANGRTERMVQTLTRAIRMYVEDEGQRDWDVHAEMLVLALNTAFDRARQETPFYLVHGWDPKTTVEAMLPFACRGVRLKDPLKWRLAVQRGYSAAREQANDLLEIAMRDRAAAHNAQVTGQKIKAGDQVWVYINRVKPGYAKKLAHLWHGPFRVTEMVNEFTAKLETRGTDYSFFPSVHVARLKLRKVFATRPTAEITTRDQTRFDFDEALLPENSWAPDENQGLFEIDEILDHRVVKKTRQGRRRMEFQVRWKGYEEPSWVAEEAMNCGGLLHDYHRRRRAANRYAAMQIEGGNDEDQG